MLPSSFQRQPQRSRRFALPRLSLGLGRGAKLPLLLACAVLLVLLVAIGGVAATMGVAPAVTTTTQPVVTS